jgi:hypothetical protein
MTCGWKLKGLLPPGGGPIGPSLAPSEGVSPADGNGEFMDPNFEGKVALVGDKELELKKTFEWIVRGPPSIPRSSSVSSGIGVGGVGVLGGAGIGRLEAIANVYCLRMGIRRSAGDKEALHKILYEVEQPQGMFDCCCGGKVHAREVAVAWRWAGQMWSGTSTRCLGTNFIPKTVKNTTTSGHRRNCPNTKTKGHFNR